MYNHAPNDYICPICLGVEGVEDDRTMIRSSDIVYKDDLVMVFIGSFFVGNNPGHPIIVPNKHFENLYDLPDQEAHQIISVSRKVAQALKESHECEGVTVRQNNEPASSQHAFHYHMHLFPRYANDGLDENFSNTTRPTPEERLLYADKLRAALAKMQ